MFTRATYMIFYRKLFNINYFFIFLLAFWGSYYIPPMQSPDENQHIARAYLLSQGDIFLSHIPEKMSGGYIDNGLYNFIQDGMLISGSPEKKFTHERKKELEQIRWSRNDDKTYLEIPGTGYYLPLIYIPHAFAMSFGKLIDLSIFDTYRFIKFFIITISLSLTFYAFSIYRPSTAILGLIVLPMSTFQLLSPTLDGFTTSICLLIISIFLKFQTKNNNSSLFYILSILVVLISTTRIHLISMVILLFLISFQTKNKRFTYISILSTFFSFSWILFSIKNTVDTRVPRSLSSIESIYHYLLHPLDFIKIFFNTISNYNMLKFYGESFIGKLGWLDTPLSFNHYIILFLTLLLLFALSLNSPSHEANNRIARLSFLLIAGTSFFTIFTALLVSWTPLSAEVIHGVQGRYFIIPCILLAYSLHGILATGSRWMLITNHFVFYLFFSFSLYSLLSAINNRFYIN